MYNFWKFPWEVYQKIIKFASLLYTLQFFGYTSDDRYFLKYSQTFFVNSHCSSTRWFQQVNRPCYKKENLFLKDICI